MNSVGKTCFVENYDGFNNLFLKGESLTLEAKKKFANDLYDRNHELTSVQAQLTRVNCAIKIFNNGWEQEALNDIALSTSKSVSSEVIEKAKELLKN